LKVFLRSLCAFSILVQFSKIQSFKPGCAPARAAVHFLCSAARIRQDISAASFLQLVVNCSDTMMSVFHSPV